MTKSHNEEVQKFLELPPGDPEKYTWLMEIREIIMDAYPKCEERIMYGGIVFFLANEMFSGLFITKNHVTLEFSNGFLLKDPKGHLEGKGKYRRHVKVTERADIVRKQVSYFVKQSVQPP